MRNRLILSAAILLVTTGIANRPDTSGGTGHASRSAD